jgi:uncharacterized protein (TIGR02145 family)
MKNLKFPLNLIFVLPIVVLLFSCEQDDQFNAEFNAEPGEESLMLKSAGTSDYIYNLFGIIDNMASSGYLNKGNSNALRKKIEHAVKSLNKGDKHGAITHLKTFVKQVNAFIHNGRLPAGEAQKLLKIAGNGQMLIKGSFIDIRDGKEYQVVLIGEQIWLAENLAYIPFLNGGYYVNDYHGSSLSEAKETYAYKTYGVLYWHETAMTSTPSGWNLPTIEEWEQLANYVSSKKGPDIGYHLKSKDGWLNSGNGSDYFGFSAYPGGYYNYRGYFTSGGYIGWWWTASPQPPGAHEGPVSCFIRWDSNSLFLYDTNYPGETGYSVRCIKD